MPNKIRDGHRAVLIEVTEGEFKFLIELDYQNSAKNGKRRSLKGLVERAFRLGLDKLIKEVGSK
jgi:hypothetical protein